MSFTDAFTLSALAFTSGVNKVLLRKATMLLSTGNDVLLKITGMRYTVEQTSDQAACQTAKQLHLHLWLLLRKAI